MPKTLHPSRPCSVRFLQLFALERKATHFHFPKQQDPHPSYHLIFLAFIDEPFLNFHVQCEAAQASGSVRETWMREERRHKP